MKMRILRSVAWLCVGLATGWSLSSTFITRSCAERGCQQMAVVAVLLGIAWVCHALEIEIWGE